MDLVERPDSLHVTGQRLNFSVYSVDMPERVHPTCAASLVAIGDDRYRCSKSGSIHTISSLENIASKGDVLFRTKGGKSIRAMLTGRSKQNTLLLTEQCDNLCSFCSQPPMDRPHLIEECMAALQLFDRPGQIGLTGGEPTLHWAELVALMEGGLRPDRSFHLLSHGRHFSSGRKVSELQQRGIIKPTLFGIPVHGSNSTSHDAVTGVKGSWDQTISGLLNLSFVGASIEIRVIVTRQVLPELVGLVKLLKATLGSKGYFLALMRMERVGWAKSHADALKPDPLSEMRVLAEAAELASMNQQDLRIYNYPLCLLPEELHAVAMPSISDWKNHFPAGCGGCSERQNCSGFFISDVGGDVKLMRPFR